MRQPTDNLAVRRRETPHSSILHRNGIPLAVTYGTARPFGMTEFALGGAFGPWVRVRGCDGPSVLVAATSRDKAA